MIATIFGKAFSGDKPCTVEAQIHEVRDGDRRRFRVTAIYKAEGEGVVQERIVGRYLRLKTALRRACAAAGHQY